MYNRCYSSLYSFCLTLALILIVGCRNSADGGGANTRGHQNVPLSIQDTDRLTAPDVPAPHVSVVEIERMRFQPEQVSINKGDTVVWVNHDLTNHCVTATDKRWTSSAMAPGQTWRKVITESSDYFCAIHVVMKGKISVKK